MQLISKYNKGIRYLFCVIDLLSKYAWVVPLKDKNVIIIVNAFRKKKEKRKRKPVQKGNQTIYGLIKAVNFITVLLKNG